MTGKEILVKCAGDGDSLTGEDRKVLMDRKTILDMYEGERFTPAKTMRRYCLDCNGSSKEVALCPCFDCLLYPYRFGTNPFKSLIVKTPEQLKASGDRLRAYRESSKAIEAEDKVSVE